MPNSMLHKKILLVDTPCPDLKKHIFKIEDMLLVTKPQNVHPLCRRNLPLMPFRRQLLGDGRSVNLDMYCMYQSLAPSEVVSKANKVAQGKTRFEKDELKPPLICCGQKQGLG